MKKFLPFLLSILILTSTFVVNSSASNDTEVDLGQEERLAEAWYCYGEGGIIGYTSNTIAPIYDFKIYNSPSESIKFFKMDSKVFATKIEGIVTGRSYELKFKYRGALTTNSTEYVIKNAGIYKSGEKIGASGSLAENASITSTEIISVTDTNIWQEYSITFTATENDLYFAATVLNAKEFWIDDFAVVIAPQRDLNIAEGWLSGSPATCHTTTKTAVFDTSVYYPLSTNSEKSSIKFIDWAYTNKVSVNPYKKYTISFYWYATYESTNEDESKALSENRLYRFPRFIIQGGNDLSSDFSVFDKEILLSGNDHTVAKYGCSDGCGGYWSDTKTYADAKNWNYYECDFYSLENTSIFIWFNSRGIYFDDIKLIEYATDFPTINFETNGGQPVASMSLKPNSSFTLPTTSKFNNNFVGWYTDQALTTKFSGTFPDKSTTLYAKWEERTIKNSGWGYEEIQGFDTWNEYVTANLSNHSPKSNKSSANTLSVDTLSDKNNVVHFKSSVPWLSSSVKESIIVNPGDRLPLNNYSILPEGGKLEVSFKYRAISGTTNIWLSLATHNWNIYTEISDSKYISSEISCKNTSWTPVTLTIDVPKADPSNAGEQIGLMFNFNNTTTAILSEKNCEIYIDDVSIKPIAKTAINYVLNNGLELDATVNYPGTEIILPTPTVKNNKIFEGWYSDAELTQKYSQTTQPSNNLTLYANWQINVASENHGIVTAYNSKGAIRAKTDSLNQGIRLYHSIDKNWIESANIKQYGILAIRSAKLLENGYNELNLGSVNKISPKNKGIAYDKNTQATPVLWADSTEQYIFTSVLTGIEEKFYDDDFLIRTYAIADDGTEFYGDTTRISVYDIVKEILENANSDDLDYITASEIVETTERLNKTANDDITSYCELNAENIKIHNNNSSIINNNFEGINIIHQLYAKMPDNFGRVYSETQIKLEYNTLKEMGIKKVRSFYGSSLSYDPISQTHDFSKNNQYLEGFVQSCLDMQELGIEVGITPQWNICALFKNGYTPSLSSNRVNIHNAGYIVFEDDGETINYDATYKNFAKFIQDSVTYFEARGIKNINQLFCFTEVNNVLSSLGEDYWLSTDSKTTYDKRNYEKLKPIFKDAVLAVDTGLKNSGLRNNYQIVAPCDNWDGDDKNTEIIKSELVSFCLSDSELLNAVDVIGSHKGYAQAESFNNQTAFYNHPATIYANSLSDLKASEKSYLIDEYNVSSLEYTYDDMKYDSTRTLKSQPMMGVALGSMVNGILNNGISGTYLWALYDQQWPNHTNTSGEFRNGIQIVGYIPTYLESKTPRPAWYSLSLLTRYIGTGTVYNVTQDLTDDSHIYISAIQRNDDEFTVVVTNYNDTASAISVELDTPLNGSSLYRYVYDANTVSPNASHEMIKSDLTLENTQSKFNDLLPKFSVTIYTTEKPIIY